MWRLVSVRVASKAFMALSLAATVAVVELAAQGGQPPNAPLPIPARNINMVSGTGWPDGDPFLQRQNEPSLAASTRNPLHLLGGSNDYRTVDIPGLPVGENGDAWLGLFKSFDGGITWKSALLPGYPQDTSAQGVASPLHGLNAAADSTVRAGTNGLFYFSGIAFDRNTSSGGKVFVARFIDNNNKEKGDTIQYLGNVAVDVGTAGHFLDKPALVVDIPRGNLTCTVAGQAAPIPAGPVYAIWSVFVGGTPQNPQGTAANRSTTPLGRSQILVSKSTDCGATFSKPQKISERYKLNQGSVAAIDPNTGALYVGWREFADTSSGDAILVSKSTDFGTTFSVAVSVAHIAPFDQGSSAATFRTQSMPTMAVDAGDVHPDGTSSGPGRVHIAWSENAAGADGDARIVVSSSADGKTWTGPIVADTRWLNDPLHPELTRTQWRGHQMMPALTFAGGRLQLVYYDFRNDASGIFTAFDPVRHVGVSETDVYNWNASHPTDKRKRHTVDVYSVQATPGLPPQFGPSVSVSRYLEGQRHKGDPRTQLQFNAVNLPLFAGGTIPFLGDYLDIAATPSFVLDPNGKWRYNMKPSDSQASVAVWADNRDVRGPPAGKTWKDYTAPTFANSALFSQFDPTQQLQVCSPGTASMRNQNIYSARITSGLSMTVLGNNKQLGYVTTNGVRRLLQRTFVVTVGNPDATSRSVVLHIGAQPPGGMASFLQFKQTTDLAVTIAPKSTISREVFVTSANRAAAVPITVTDAATSALAASAVLNPDITNPDITNPDITNPGITNPDITNAEAHAVSVSNPDITNPDITNPDITNPDITNPDITNPDITNPDITNPDITNPDITNPDITNPDITNPDITNPDITNSSLTDVTWSVVNKGNTATSYQIKLLLADAKRRNLLRSGAKLQLVVTKSTVAAALGADCKPVPSTQNTLVANIIDPAFVDPSNSQQFSTVVNPDITNPDITNTTVALAPGDTAYVTLRVFSPIADGHLTSGGGPSAGGDPLKDLTGALEELKNLGVATTSHPVDTLDVAAGSTTPKIEASVPLIVTTTPPDAVRTVAYVTTIQSVGGTVPRVISIATGSLPPGIVLNSATGALAGTPVQAGAFTFVARVTDANAVSSESTLTIRVFEPLVVAGSALPGGVVNQPYSATLSAVGGVPPYGWAVTGGTLPAGVTFSSGGGLSGNPTQSGTFTFTATATDAASPSQIASASLTLTVTPAANAQTVTVVEDTATAILVTATGAPAASFTFGIGNQPSHGTLSGAGPTFTYTPASNYSGPDSLTFRAVQGTLASAFATVSLTVTAVNDAPAATPLTVTTPQVTPVSITLTGTDPENSALTFSIVAPPANGTLTGAPPTVTYTPKNAFSGTDTFTFRASDGSLFSAPATVSVIVGNPPAGSADVTAALAGSAPAIDLGGTIVYTAAVHNNGPAIATGVTLNVGYPSADLALQSVSPSQGLCTTASPIVCTVGSIAVGANAVLTITAKAYNHGGAIIVSAVASAAPLDYNTSNNAATQTTTINGPATATTDLSVTQTAAPLSIDFGGTAVYTMTVANNGPSGATGVALTGTFTSSAGLVSFMAGQGTCSVAGSQFSCSVGSLANGASAVYTLTLKATGVGSFSNTAALTGNQSDPNATNNSSTVSVSVNNRVPTAAADSAAVLEDGTTTIAVLANDADPDSDPLSVTVVSLPGHGTAARNADNTITYTPATDYFGDDSFTYAISDGRGGTATATVTVSVLAVNDPPSFVGGPNQTVNVNAAPRTVPGWATGISKGPANEAPQHLDFVLFNTNHALFSVQPSVAVDGTLTYTIAPGTTGSSTATVVLHDDGGTANGGNDSSAPYALTITVSSNVPPVATDDAASTSENTAITLPVLANDTDGNSGDTLTVDGVTQPVNGTASINSASTVLYTPNTNFAGVDTFTYRIHDAAGAQSAFANVTVTVNATGSANFVVTNANDSGPGSLRAAILNSNANIAPDTITFKIAGVNFATIAPLSPLPVVTDAVLIDGRSQTGLGTVGIELDGSSAGINATGLVVSGSNSTVRGLVINRFAVFGISILSGASGNHIEGNYIGTNADGSAASPNGIDGLQIASATTTVGGTTTAARNVISGNGRDGIHVIGGTLNTIHGNYIGVDISGNNAIANGRNGVTLEQSTQDLVGGTNSGEGNVISGNTGHGVHVFVCDAGHICDGERIQGNVIGLTANGQSTQPNHGNGVRIQAAPNNTIGGSTPGARNLISANLLDGIDIREARSTNNFVGANYIGTDVSGNFAAPNHRGGIVVTAPSNVIGSAGGGGNLISGNVFGTAVGLDNGANGTQVKGNFIGTNAAGTSIGNLGNGRGIDIFNSASFNVIGDTSGGGNVIAGTLVSPAIQFFNGANDNRIDGNFIGTDVSRSVSMRNSGGINVGTNSHRNTLFGNVVANNGSGVEVVDGIGNVISQNSIYNNTGLGIDIGPGGVTANDTGDGDTGPNNLQNFPVLTQASATGGSMLIAGTLNSTPNSSYSVELFSNAALDPSGYGEGQQYLGSASVTTDASGNGSFAATLLVAVAPGAFITSTSTDAIGNTSEFSMGRIVVANQSPTATNDSATTTSGSPVTMAPAANDTDPDNPSPSIVKTVRAVSAEAPVLTFPGEIAVVNSTGLAYFGAFGAVAGLSQIGILDTASDAIVGVIPVATATPAFSRVNQTTNFVYFRVNPNTILAIDGRPASATFNQVVLSLQLGTSIQSFAIDQLHGLLYVTNATNGGAGSQFQSRVSIVDIDPSHQAFHQVLDDVVMPAGGNARGIAVRATATSNKIYVASLGGSTGGVFVLDGVTKSLTRIPNTNNNVNIVGVAVNEAANLVYATATANATGLATVLAIDGATDTFLTSIPLSGFLQTGTFERRLAIHEATGRVYVRNNTTPTADVSVPSAISVIDGDRSSLTFNTVLTQIVLGRENGNTDLVVDQTGKRVITTSSLDDKTTVIDVATNAILDTIPSAQGAFRIGLNAATHRAFITGEIGFIQAVGLGVGPGQAIAVTNPSFESHNAFDIGFYNNGPIVGWNSSGIAGQSAPPPSCITPLDGTVVAWAHVGTIWQDLVETVTPGRTYTLRVGVGRCAGGGNNGYAVRLKAGGVTLAEDIHPSPLSPSWSASTVTYHAPMNASAGVPLRIELESFGNETEFDDVRLVADTATTIIPTGVEITAPVIDPTTHVAYLGRTGLTTGIARFDDTGDIGTVTGLPHGSGRIVFTARNATTGLIYALNTAAGTTVGSDALPGFVAVIDPATNTAVANVPAGNFPFGLGVNAITNKIYVGNAFAGPTYPGGITIVDGSNNYSTQAADISQIPLFPGLGAGQIAVQRDIVPNVTTGKVYFRIVNGSPTTIGVLNGTVAAPLPASLGPVNIIRVNPTLNRIYVGGQAAGQANQLHVLDGATDQEIGTPLTVGSPSPFNFTQSYVLVSQGTGRVYVANYLQNSLAVISGATNAIVATLPVGRGPTSVAGNETTHRIYVANALDRTVTVINADTLRIESTVTLPLVPVRLVVDEALSRIWALGAPLTPGVMLISDPANPNGPLTVTSVTQGAAGVVTINADGTVSYNPNANVTGPDTFTYTTADGHGGTATGTVNVIVNPVLSITTASLPNSSLGQTYNQTLTATGGSGALVWSINASVGGQQLPAGLAFSSTGMLSGKVSSAGTSTFTVQVSDSSTPLPQIATRTFTIVAGPPVVTTTFLPNATVNTPYSQPVTVGGATGAVTWTLNTNNSPLLAWLSLSSAGVLSGTPPSYGTTPSFTVTATDSLNQIALRALALFVTGPLAVTPTTLREGVVLEPQPSLPIVGGNGAKTVTVTAGALPPGVTLTSTGAFTGTPTRHGTFNFTVQVQDCALSSGLPTCSNTTAAQTVSQALTWRVSSKDQQGFAQLQPAISFGGSGGRKFAQVVTAGANGNLTAFGLTTPSCSSSGPVTVEIQGLSTNGTPDGITIASGTAITDFNVIALSPTVPMTIDQRFAAVISSPTSCDIQNAPATFDGYAVGDALSNAGGGWLLLKDTDGRYDLPFRTLIQPAVPLTYLTKFRSAPSFSNVQFGVPLNNGKVLLIGSDGTAELMDPVTSTSTATGSLNIRRNQSTVTPLLDGTVLVTGGSVFNGTTTTSVASAEIYNPATGAFTLASGSLANGRSQHAAVRLADGRVLITGGFGASLSTLQSAEIYDPATQTFSATGNLVSFRASHTTVLLGNGNVLLVGGSGSSVGGELYNPVTGTFAVTANSTVVPRAFGFTATLLQNGKVLLAGGGANAPSTNAAELYDPATNSFIATGNLGTARANHTAVAMADGSVLVAGGSGAGVPRPLATLERYLPASGTFIPAGDMEVGRSLHAAIRLSNDQILLAGGSGGQSWLTGDSAELYDAATTPALTTASLPDGQVNVAYPATALTATGGSGPAYQIAIVSGTLPPGLSYAPGTSTVSGTPTAAGVFTVGINVVDSANHSSVQPLSVSVSALRITTTSLPFAVTGNVYNQQLVTSGGVGAVNWRLWSGSLPPGLTLSASGVIAGTTTGPGSSFSARAIDSLGQSATSASMFLSVQSPLSITTTSLTDGVVSDFYGNCLSANFGSGSRTWTVANGSLPKGVTLQSNGCFTGSVSAFGTFSFTAQVTDQSVPPQIDMKALSINVSTGIDQGASWDSNQAPLAFGNGTRIGQRVVAGVSGLLTAVRINSLSCLVGTIVTAEIQGLASNGGPDNNTLASGTAPVTFTNPTFGVTLTVPLSTSTPFAADSAFALVFSANGACAVKPTAFDSYADREAYVWSGAAWQRLQDVDGRSDIPFQTLVQPPSGALSIMTAARGAHTSTLLSGAYAGKVLLTGNNQTAEIYDQSSGVFTQTGNMSRQRAYHTAALLDDGTVLIVGGLDFSTSTYLASAEIFHPDTGTFELLGSTLSSPRYEHTATKLPDGRVLVAGGFSYDPITFGHPLNTADIYNPGSRTFTTASGTMSRPRERHTATLLLDGRVLLAGGYGSGAATADFFDPVTTSLTPTALPMVRFRAVHTATLLGDGRVLLAGGGNVVGDTQSAELFDPAGSGTFTAAGTMSSPRLYHTATLLGDGSVLITGGQTDNSCCAGHPPVASAERFVPGTGFTGAGSMTGTRYVHTATALPNGKVLLSGSFGWSQLANRSAELYDPATAVSLVSANLPVGHSGVPYAATTLTAQGGTGPYTITQTTGNLPAGLGYNAGTRTISGTPSQSGTFSASFTITDFAGHTNAQTLTIQIDPLVITSPAQLATAYAGTAYSATLSATGVGPVTWSVLFGSLPPGLTLTGTTISGTPTVSCCFYSFTVRATDSIGQTTTKSIAINVQTPLTITTTSLDAGVVTWGYGACIQTNGGSFPRTFSITSGALPAGVTLDPNNGCLGTGTGSIAAAGTSVFTVKVTDGNNPPQEATRPFTIRVGANDQNTGSFDQTQPALPFGNGVRLAQTFRQWLAGDLIAVLAPVACAAQPGATFTIDIMPVDGLGHIGGGAPLLSESFNVSMASPFNGQPYSRTFTFSSSLAVPLNIRLAAVFSSATASCSWVEELPTSGNQWTYAHGAGFKGTGGPVVWAPIAQDDPVRPNLPLFTTVDPNGALDFMSNWRTNHTATGLANGTVLLTGGNGGFGSSAVLYTLNTRRFAATNQPMVVTRQFHTATPLQNGTVLIVGGRDQTTMQPLSTAEIYDPVGGTFTAITGNLGRARFYHTSTLLNDGRVLITGGNIDWGIALSSTELYDPTLGTFSPGPTMIAERAEHTATLLASGDVLILGGWGNSPLGVNAERYVPAGGGPGSVVATSGQPLAFRATHTATRLLSDKILIAGGWSNGLRTTTAEIYDQGTDSFVATGSLAIAAGHHAAALLGDGRVLIAGGDTDSGDSAARLELFNPAGGGTFSSANTMAVPRAGLTATIIGMSGKVLLTGGYGPSNGSAPSGELFDPAQTIVTVQNPTLPDGLRGQPYGPLLLLGTGGAAPYHFTFVSGTLPPNVTFDSSNTSSNGSISGTPPNDNTASGTYSFAVRVSDNIGVSAVQTLRLRIDPLDITTSGLPNGFVGQPYNATLAATGIGALTWSVVGNSGTLPSGLTLNANGTITGTPTQQQVTSFVVQARDSVGQTSTRWLSLGVNPP